MERWSYVSREISDAVVTPGGLAVLFAKSTL